MAIGTHLLRLIETRQRGASIVARVGRQNGHPVSDRGPLVVHCRTLDLPRCTRHLYRQRIDRVFNSEDDLTPDLLKKMPGQGEKVSIGDNENKSLRVVATRADAS